ncbi:MAG: hypothetical protein ACE5FJ_05575 [Gemmatimonadales bacterium]
MRHQIDLVRLQQTADASAQMARRALGAAQGAQQNQQANQELLRTVHDLQKLVHSLQATRGGNPGVQYIENIPGRRIPFDYLVDIIIGPNIVAQQQGTITIDQDGPFVAVSRVATFVSQYGFERTDPETSQTAIFNGRSFGRYRPIHSACDLNDGQPPSEVVKAVAFPGTGAPYTASVSNASPFRTMESDYRIKFENAGSSFPRSNLEVPSPFWTEFVNSPFKLGALDFFERGEVMTFKVLPQHANNAAFGNISGGGAPNPSFPFIDSQWDRVEGINDQNDAAAGDTDPITRAPQGILTIGFHGFKIIQQPGAGYT